MNGIQPRILITRLSHIGDCVLTLPLANAIKDAHPNCFLAWTVEPPTNQILSRIDAIDQLVHVPKGWMKSWAAWRRLRRELKALRFDIAVDPQGMTKSAALGWLSGAPTRIGLRGRWGREISPWLNNRLVKPSTQHLVDRTLELLDELEIGAPTPEFRFAPDSSSRAFVDEFLNRQNLNQFAIINPGAGWRSKRWDVERFGELAQRMMQQHKMRTVITWAGDQEHQMARSVFACSDSASILAPPTRLLELAALCERSSVFVGGDTGPLHIASAVGARCVSLHGTTRPVESGAYGPQHVAVQVRYHSGSSRVRRSANNDAMLEITTDMVFDAVTCCLERRAAAAA